MNTAQSNETYYIQHIDGSGKYRVLCNGAEIATDLSFSEAVTLVENAMYCKEDHEK